MIAAAFLLFWISVALIGALAGLVFVLAVLKSW